MGKWGTMKIALYTGTFVKNKDGVARTLYEFVRCIRERGHEIMIWSPEVTEGVEDEFIRVQKLVSVPVIVYPDYKVGFFGPRTKRQLDRMKPDLIHVSTPDLVGREFLQYGKRNNIPVVSVYHTDFPSYLSYYQLGVFSNAVWGYLKWFYNNSRASLVPTIAMQNRLREKGINNSIIWSRGIRETDFSPKFRSEKLRKEWGVDDSITILYSGRFVWYKDLKIFISVSKKLREKYGKKVSFVLLGSGPAEDDLKESMPYAVFPGYLSGKDLSTAYASGDILLFPSTTETFGNVVQEALASGIPSVVSDTGGCKEIISLSKGGLISISKDVSSFTENVSTLIEDNDLYNSLRSNGLEFSTRRSWKYINDELLREYSDYVREFELKRETP
jgi:glycosyltransferase involved in cell wall biosynthesis